MAVLMRRAIDWRELPTEELDYSSPVDFEQVLLRSDPDDLPPPPQPSRVTAWPLVVSLLWNVILLGAVVRLVVGR